MTKSPASKEMDKALFRLQHGFNMRGSFVRVQKVAPSAYPQMPNFHITDGYIDGVRKLYSARNLPDLSAIHFERLGCGAFNEAAGLDHGVEMPVDTQGFDPVFERDIRTGISLLPGGVRRLLAERGTKTTLIKTVGPGRFYAGLFDPNERKITIPHIVRRKAEPGKLVPTVIATQAILHENGHALDYTSPAFKDLGPDLNLTIP